MRNLIPGLCSLLFLVGSAIADPGAQEPAAVVQRKAPAPAAHLEGEKGGYLIGPITRVQWEAFDPDLAVETRSYEPAPDLVEALVAGGAGIRILCVLGTWCHDSQREVPRFWKIRDRMGAGAFDLEMIAVGRSNAIEALDWEEDQGIVPGYRSRYDVEYVPTFIVLDAGVEIGRIIESPGISLEADLATILGVTPSPRMH